LGVDVNSSIKPVLRKKTLGKYPLSWHDLGTILFTDVKIYPEG
jgi:hypothetical protein